MDDKSIVDLYWQRSERAIQETEARYGSVLLRTMYSPTARMQTSALMTLGSKHGTPCHRTGHHCLLPTLVR